MDTVLFQPAAMSDKTNAMPSSEVKRVCKTCDSDETTERMSGEECWHLFSESSTEHECHKCDEKVRKQAKKELPGREVELTP